MNTARIATSLATAALALTVSAPAGATEPSAVSEGGFADFVTLSTHPLPWLDWGADLRLRNEYLEDAFMNSAPQVYDQLRTRARAWISAQPADFLEFHTRFTWESRYFLAPDAPVPAYTHDRQVDSWEGDELIIDSLDFSLTNLLELPLTLTVGRQDLFLGGGWLLGEGTPLDESRTRFFDAARVDYDLEVVQTLVTALYIEQRANSDAWLPPLGAQDHRRYLTEQHERGSVLYLHHHSLTNAALDAFFLYKHDDRVLPNGTDADLFAFGVHADVELKEHWQVRTDLAIELGKRNDRDFEGLGVNAEIAYLFHDSWQNQIRGAYEYLSGDDPETPEDDRFDPFWGRWARWSELLYYNPSFGNTTRAGDPRIGDWGNYHRINVGWGFRPLAQLSLAADYHALWAAQDELYGGDPWFPFSTKAGFRGHLLTSLLEYSWTRHLKADLRGEIFWPEEYYYGHPMYTRETEFFLRAQLCLSW